VMEGKPGARAATDPQGESPAGDRRIHEDEGDRQA